jgi:hypothetical protein
MEERMKDIYDFVAADDLTPDLAIICDVCGMDTVKEMLRKMPGLSLYIPKTAHLETLVTRYLSENTDKTLLQIAKDAQVSIAYLRQLERKILMSKKKSKI